MDVVVPVLTAIMDEHLATYEPPPAGIPKTRKLHVDRLSRDAADAMEHGTDTHPPLCARLFGQSAPFGRLTVVVLLVAVASVRTMKDVYDQSVARTSFTLVIRDSGDGRRYGP